MIALLRTERFKKDFKRLPREIQTRTAKALALVLSNPKHPSLHVKRMEGAPNIWELRVSRDYRVTFQFEPEGVLLRRIGTHDILNRP